MKRLMLLRHAKAAPAVLGGDDYERELAPGGADDAARIGDFLAARGLQPEIVVSSSARRTLATAGIVAGRWRQPPSPISETALYDANRHMILAVARELPDNARSALIVGHNPGIGECASWLAGEGEPTALMKAASKFPTSGLAIIAFDCAKWREVAPRAGRLELFVTPADLAAI